MKRQMETWRVLALVCLVIGVSTIQAHAAACPTAGAVAATGCTISNDTQLTGNIDCTAVGTGSCMKFVADDIQLDLNGFTVIGPNNCALTTTGIDTNMHNQDEIKGPGKVKQFTTGVDVNGGQENQVQGIVAFLNCRSGIRVGSTSIQNEIEGNIAYLNQGAGIRIFGSNNDVQKNQSHSNAFEGVLVEAGGTGNQIEENSLVDNGADGIDLREGTANNQVNENIILGNPTEDIEDLGSNTVTDKNVCEFGNGAAASVCGESPMPSFKQKFEVRKAEQAENEKTGSWTLEGEGTPTRPYSWVWTPAWAGSLPLLPAPPLP